MTATEIRKYNEEVRKYQKKATELQASVEYKKKELENLCKELSELSGETVTPENLEEFAAKIEHRFEQTVSTGREVLARAKAEEERVNVTPIAQSEAVQPETGEAAPTNSPAGNVGLFGNMDFGKFPGFSGGYDTTGSIDSI